MLVYVASPYTLGDKLANVHVSMDAANELVKLGHIPYLPLLTHYWDEYSAKPYNFWLEYDLTFLPICHAVLRLPGESHGADGEVTAAQKLGIPVYYSIEEIAALI
jgi:hypothetical protein